jgi:8-oxo-dGTP diphosphatase
MLMSRPLLLVVAAALVRKDQHILVQQRAPHRSMAGLWEFPGGKVEPGEAPEDALAREIDEELGVTLDRADLAPLTFASELLGERNLVLLLYRVTRWQGEPRPLDASAIRWASVEELRTLPMPPADVPLLSVLARSAGFGA